MLERKCKMARSMTGFGRCETTVNGRDIVVEIKSVNHKFFEFFCRTSRGYSFLEERLKSAINSRVSRGKLDVFVSVSVPLRGAGCSHRRFSPPNRWGSNSSRVKLEIFPSSRPRWMAKVPGQNSAITWRQTPQGGQKSCRTPSFPPTMAMA